MRPEFPEYFNPSNYMQTNADRESPCNMLKLGENCGNDTYNILICERTGGGFHIIAICHQCQLDAAFKGEEATAYWRDKQREWGVR